MMTDKITQEHLAGTAYVYIRQSTPDQIANNEESRERQYALRERVRTLGWSDPVTIDEDLGRSGGGRERPGYERLLAAVCRGDVGIVVAVEASRLARNGRDWHRLLEFCGLVGTLIADEETVYDPRLIDDRLLLGMKGVMSEMELTAFHQRSQAALKQKAERGELHTRTPIGYVRAAGDRLEKDPDLRVQEGVALVFRKFRELGSVRQVLLWLKQENIKLPATGRLPGETGVVWKSPVYNTVYHILVNPTYAGAYARGKTSSRTAIDQGRKHVSRGHRQPREQWQVLIRDHHSGYISWAEYEANQQQIAQNVTKYTGHPRTGPARRGKALLGGLLRCGHCGRKLYVTYSGAHGQVPRYACYGAKVNHGGAACISFGGMRPDEAVVNEVLRVLQPDGIKAALEAAEERRDAQADKRRQTELALEQARYEAQRARKQYDAVDPDNRLVAAELEQRWNEQLSEVQRLEQELAEIPQAEVVVSSSDRERLLALGADLRSAWDQPSTTVATKKRLLRTVLVEIVAEIEAGVIRLTLHWQGGDHTRLEVKKNQSGQHGHQTSTETIELLRELARLMPDPQIASMLNRLGRRTGQGRTWTEGRVRSARNARKIPAYVPGEMAERDELKLWEAAQALNTGKMTALRLIRDGRIRARQPCPGGPWIVQKSDVDVLAPSGEYSGDRPVTLDPRQKTLDIQ
jgi:excisionase family DNA binding protein